MEHETLLDKSSDDLIADNDPCYTDNCWRCVAFIVFLLCCSANLGSAAYCYSDQSTNTTVEMYYFDGNSTDDSNDCDGPMTVSCITNGILILMFFRFNRVWRSCKRRTMFLITSVLYGINMYYFIDTIGKAQKDDNDPKADQYLFIGVAASAVSWVIDYILMYPLVGNAVVEYDSRIREEGRADCMCSDICCCIACLDRCCCGSKHSVLSPNTIVNPRYTTQSVV